MASNDALLTTVGLKTYFPIRSGFNPFSRGAKRYLHAVDGANLKVLAGERPLG